MLLEIPKNRKNAFVFTLDANSDSGDQEQLEDNYFNCMCI